MAAVSLAVSLLQGTPLWQPALWIGCGVFLGLVNDVLALISSPLPRLPALLAVLALYGFELVYELSMSAGRPSFLRLIAALAAIVAGWVGAQFLRWPSLRRRHAGNRASNREKASLRLEQLLGSLDRGETPDRAWLVEMADLICRDSRRAVAMLDLYERANRGSISTADYRRSFRALLEEDPPWVTDS